MHSEELHASVVNNYAQFINPYLAKLMDFAGFGIEVQAEGCYMFDESGKKYLDCLGGYGVFALGHRHPKVVEAVKSQLNMIPLSGKTFFSQRTGELAAKLAELTPGDLQFSFFSNSGTEAVEAALKFAKATTGRAGIVSTEGSYHGKSIGALSTTGRPKYRTRFEPLMPGVTFVPFGDTDAAVAAITSDTAAFIVEPVQGEGGIHVAPEGYLPALREACDKVGALLIFDEVQTGMGRTGKMFGCEHDQVTPDIMTLAKALGGGVMPIGATVMTPAVNESMFSENPLLHTSTFGGNPLACAAGLAALEVIQEEGLVERSRVLGDRMKAGFESIMSKHDLLASVRGRGLMIGVEFSMDEVGELAIAQMVKRGLVAAYALNNPRVIRFEPPLIISEEEVDWAVDTFSDSVQETAELLAAFAD